MISSSTIRSLIDEGKMAEAVALLGHPYRLRGEVVTGARRGQTIGFPTANLAKIETLLPADGVYGGIGRVGDRSFAAAINIGPNPTFGEQNRKVEVHLVDFSGDLYGSWLDVDLLERIRPTAPLRKQRGPCATNLAGCGRGPGPCCQSAFAGHLRLLPLSRKIGS